MKSLVKYINEEKEESFLILVKTKYSDGGYFIDKDDFEYKLIKDPNGQLSYRDSPERKKLEKKLEKWNVDGYTWVKYGDQYSTREKIRKEMKDPHSIERFNKEQAKTALTFI